MGQCSPLDSDFADQFPGCDVIGTDISPIQPGWVPPNLRLCVIDPSNSKREQIGS